MKIQALETIVLGAGGQPVTNLEPVKPGEMTTAARVELILSNTVGLADLFEIKPGQRLEYDTYILEGYYGERGTDNVNIIAESGALAADVRVYEGDEPLYTQRIVVDDETRIEENLATNLGREALEKPRVHEPINDLTRAARQRDKSETAELRARQLARIHAIAPAVGSSILTREEEEAIAGAEVAASLAHIERTTELAVTEEAAAA